MPEDSSTSYGEMRKYMAELLGTFALVFFGCGSAVLVGISGNGHMIGIGGIGLVGISFAFGVTVLMMVYAIGAISGCHINPAITISMLVAKKISFRNAVAYIAAQCIGAVIGAGMLLAIAMGMPGYSLATNGLGQNGWGTGYLGEFTMTSAFLTEVVMTFFFLLVIFGATSDAAPKGFAGIAIGLSLFVIHLVSIPITGTSVNPARSLGPAVFVQGTALNQLWLFWVAPIIGGILAAVVWGYILDRKAPEPAKSHPEPKNETEIVIDDD